MQNQGQTQLEAWAVSWGERWPCSTKLGRTTGRGGEGKRDQAEGLAPTAAGRPGSTRSSVQTCSTKLHLRRPKEDRDVPGTQRTLELLELLVAQPLTITVRTSRRKEPAARSPAAHPSHLRGGGGGRAFAALPALTVREPQGQGGQQTPGVPASTGVCGGLTSHKQFTNCTRRISGCRPSRGGVGRPWASLAAGRWARARRAGVRPGRAPPPELGRAIPMMPSHRARLPERGRRSRRRR